jgi:hypothetical protein
MLGEVLTSPRGGHAPDDDRQSHHEQAAARTATEGGRARHQDHLEAGSPATVRPAGLCRNLDPSDRQPGRVERERAVCALRQQAGDLRGRPGRAWPTSARRHAIRSSATSRPSRGPSSDKPPRTARRWPGCGSRPGRYRILRRRDGIVKNGYQTNSGICLALFVGRSIAVFKRISFRRSPALTGQARPGHSGRGQVGHLSVASAPLVSSSHGARCPCVRSGSRGAGRIAFSITRTRRQMSATPTKPAGRNVRNDPL